MRMVTSIRQAREHLATHPDDGRVVDPPVVVERIGPLSFRASDPAGASVVSAMPEGIGGDAAGMTPGTLLRGAIGCCDATVIAMEAAARGIELSRLEVEVASTSDDRGLLGVAGVTPEPIEVTVTYRLTSPEASDDELRSLVEAAEAASPVLQAMRREVPVRSVVEVGQEVVG